ncbi:hypothetical protein IJ21_06450 [Paenibacillus sp. 32O-W]|nr:hypothetical protein IJ21_06450 [Paenibacillus sp. 32O-W]
MKCFSDRELWYHKEVPFKQKGSRALWTIGLRTLTV